MKTAPEWSEDALLDGRVRLVQARSGYRVAMDSVFLAAAVPARDGDHVLDIGTGSAAAALCLARRVGGVAVDGLEIQDAMCLLAERNIGLNGVGDRVRVLSGDLLDPPAVFAGAPFAGASYDHVMANPPHLEAAKAVLPAAADRAIAHVEGRACLADWVRFALRMARPGATLTFLHRFDRCEELLAQLAEGAGALQVLPLLPMAGKAAKRVLVQGRKGAAASQNFCDGLVLHEPDGSYTKAAQAVLRTADALVLGAV
ncbi:MAG: methyltransferase [Rhodospirillaceae bacterium]|nr:MAG: methyltransferase [Rhodospirillaceae bacterium]